MTHTDQIELVSLECSGLTLAHPADDLRGQTVVDPHRHRVGKVDDLIIDREERRPRLLVVTSGGILGLGTTMRLIPVDAVVRVDEQVHIEAPHTQVHLARSDAEVDPTRAYREMCASYGYSPFWGPGYIYPYFLGRTGGP
ncbi:PRC-barrel domain-containing protein [Nocardioides dilutus]